MVKKTGPIFYVGLAFAVIGIIGAIIIMVSFDWGAFSDARDYPMTSGIDPELMTINLITTSLQASAMLLGNVAVGTILIALDQIIQILRGTHN